MKAGDKITSREIVGGPKLVHGFVSRVVKDKVHWTRTAGEIGAFEDERTLEGVEWCQGHDGPAVDALRAAIALEP